MPRYNQDPREMTAKFNSTCSGCGKPIKKGDAIFYWPATRTAKCDCGQEDFAKCMNSIFDEDVLMR